VLPPVSAISLFPEPTTPAPQPVAKAQPVLASVANDRDAAMPVSGGRLGAMALSVQLQLAQGLSVFAETVGALLQLARGQNEGLDDYARRIATAVQALPPSEQAQLEKMLNQLVRGATLRLLADMLKDQAGPDAARLLASLETMQSAGKDMAATAAVTSYLQNDGPDARAPRPAAPPALSNPPAAPAGAAALPVAANAASGTGTTGMALPLTDPTPPPGAHPGDQAAAPAKTIILQSPAAAATPAAAANPGAISPPFPLQSTLPAPAPIDPAALAQPPGGLSSSSAASIALPNFVAGGTVVSLPAAAPAFPASIAAAMDLALPMADLETVKAEAVAVAGALAKLPHAISTTNAMTIFALPAADDALPAPPVKIGPVEATEPTEGDMDANPVRAITERLVAELLGKPILPAAPPGLARPERSGADALIASLIAGSPVASPVAAIDHAALPGKTPGMLEPSAAGLPGGTDPHLLTTGSVVPAKAVARSNPQGADGFTDAPPLGLPVFVPREGVPLAFVPYPPAAEQKRERGGRKAQPVTKVDEEGEEPPPSGQQRFYGHDRDTDQPGGKPGEQESPDGGQSRTDASESETGLGQARADDFYRRMADWS
jgi:hypothetical protein